MDGLLIGYARVSTDGQDLTAQRDALMAMGVVPERIYVDQGLTGTNRDRRGLREALAACRAGDTLVVTKLDRLARSVVDLAGIVQKLEAKKVDFIVMDQGIDTTTMYGRLQFNILAAIGEFERELIKERSMEGA